MRAYIDGHHNGDLLGEFGVGALEVGKLVGLMLQDEKALGTVHIAVGSNYHECTNAPDYGQKNHCDGVITRATLVTSKGDIILKDGVYQPQRIGL